MLIIKIVVWNTSSQLFFSLLVPSFRSEWFWYYWQGPKPFPDVVEFMKENYPPDWTYADFAEQFNPPNGIYNPAHWADIFNASGAR